MEGRTRAQRWLEGSIAAWERDGRISSSEAASLRAELGRPSFLAVLPHFGVHLAIGAVLRFPIGSITRAGYTLSNLLLATLWLFLRRIDRRQWRQAAAIHAPLVILIAGMPGIGTFAYLASKPIRSNHLLLRVGVDAVLLRLPGRVYERTGVRWLIARPIAAAAPQSPLHVRLTAQTIVLLLGGIAAGLTAADFLWQVAIEVGLIDPTAMGWEQLTRMLDLDKEASFGTWYSAMMFVFLASMLAAIAFVKRRAGDRFGLHWLILALLCVGFSLDEVVQLHDPGGHGFAEMRDRLGLGGPFHYSWVVFGAFCAAVVAYGYRHFISSLPQATRRLYMLAAALYVAGEVVFESISGWYVDATGSRGFIYQTIVTAEEGLSIAGIFIAVAATLHYIESQYGQIQIALRDRASEVGTAPADRSLPAAALPFETLELAGGTPSANGAAPRTAASHPS